MKPLQDKHQWLLKQSTEYTIAMLKLQGQNTLADTYREAIKPLLTGSNHNVLYATQLDWIGKDNYNSAIDYASNYLRRWFGTLPIKHRVRLVAELLENVTSYYTFDKQCGWLAHYHNPIRWLNETLNNK